MAPLKKSIPCFCGRACVYHLIRCDACHRGVHFACIGMSLAEAKKMTVYICRACQSTAQKENVVGQLEAEDRPGAVVFTTICHRHNKDTGHRRGKTTSALVHHGEFLSKALCNVCEHRCNFEFIQCDECEAWCHYACAKMTPELAARIDEWFCRRCLKKHPGLEITYMDDNDANRLHQGQTTKGGHSGARQLKRRGEPSGSDLRQKKPCLDATHAVLDAESELELALNDDAKPELNLDDELELELKRADDRVLASDHEDEELLEYGLEDEPWSWT